MKAWFKGFALSVLVSIFAIASVVYLDGRGFFQLKTLQIDFVDSHQAAYFPAMNEWKQQLKEEMKTWQGISLFELPMSQIKAKITPLDWIENYSVQRRFPNKLKVELVPKPWIALIKTKNRTEFIGLSEKCELLPKVGMLNSMDLPIVNAKTLNTDKKRKALCDLFGIIKENRIFSPQNTAHVDWGKDGLSLQLMEPQVQINIGSEDFDKRSKRIERVLQYMEEKSLTPQVITSSFQQKVVVKLRKAR
jgi:cell division septal protein FtsQ